MDKPSQRLSANRTLCDEGPSFRVGMCQVIEGGVGPVPPLASKVFLRCELPFEGMCHVLTFFGGFQPYFMHFPHFKGFMREIQERGSGHTKLWMEGNGSPRPQSSTHA